MQRGSVFSVPSKSDLIGPTLKTHKKCFLTTEVRFVATPIPNAAGGQHHVLYKMAPKRELDDDAGSVGAAPSTKRPKREGTASKRNHQNAYMDPTWGQKYFFLGQDAATTVPQEDDLEFEDDSAALEYLRGVR